MQLTIDVDKNFIEKLQQEFHTSNIKDALNQLLDFYQETHKIENNLDKEINHRIQSYKNGSLDTKEFHNGLEKIRENILAKI